VQLEVASVLVDQTGTTTVPPSPLAAAKATAALEVNSMRNLSFTLPHCLVPNSLVRLNTTLSTSRGPAVLDLEQSPVLLLTLVYGKLRDSQSHVPFSDCSTPLSSLSSPSRTMDVTTDNAAGVNNELDKMLVTTMVRAIPHIPSCQHAETDILASLKLSIILYGR